MALSYADPVCWHEIGRLSQRRGTVWRVHRYKLIQIGWPGLAIPARTLLARPALYRKTPVHSRADLTVYIRTISGRADLTCILYIVYILYIFTMCAQIGLTFFCTDYPPARLGLAIPPNIGIYIYARYSFTFLLLIEWNETSTPATRWAHWRCKHLHISTGESQCPRNVPASILPENKHDNEITWSTHYHAEKLQSNVNQHLKLYKVSRFTKTHASPQ